MKRVTIAALLLAFLSLPAFAQDYLDEPGQGVARLSVASGDVTIRRGDTGEFVAGERNAPLVELDHVITAENARAEIQFDWANMIRLAPDAEVRLGELEEGNFFLQVIEGTTTFRVLRDSSAVVEISTPTASVRPLERGSYRVTVLPDGSTDITVRSGEAEIFTARQNEILRSGRTMEVRGDPDNPRLAVVGSIPRDEWDRWNETRDSDLDRSDSYKYVSRDIYGADDLIGHGRWVYDSPYGWVWVPTVSSTWAPYRDGRWVWVNYYGWTWVSSDPWGWAPYHYGRWYHQPRYGWVWYPGAHGPRHYWRPALVAFFGFGLGSVNVSVGFGFGNVGWVPLAPYEVFRPWYGRRPTQVTVNNVTIVNNINIINTYRNARFINGRTGITSVHTRDFGRRPVTINNIVRVTDRDVIRVGEVRGRIPFEASRESRQFSDRVVNTRVTQRVERNDRAVVRRTAAPAGGAANANVTVRPANAAGNRGNQDRVQPQAGGLARPNGNAANPNAGIAVSPQENGNGRGNSGNARGAIRRAEQPAARVNGNEAPAPAVRAAQPQPPADNSNGSRTARGAIRRTEQPAVRPDANAAPAPAARAPEPRVPPDNGNANRTARGAIRRSDQTAVRPEPNAAPAPAARAPEPRVPPDNGNANRTARGAIRRSDQPEARPQAGPTPQAGPAVQNRRAPASQPDARPAPQTQRAPAESRRNGGGSVNRPTAPAPEVRSAPGPAAQPAPNQNSGEGQGGGQSESGNRGRGRGQR